MLSLSRLTPWKGIHVLLDALAILSERLPADMGLEITIAGAAHFGEEEYEASLKERARNMRFPVAFVGHVDNVDDLLADTDILVHTSTTPEPFGQVIIQGLASGAHTIVADAGGAAEIVLATKRGMRTTPGDAQELAAAIERIVRDGRSASGPDLPVRYTDPAVAGAIDGQLQRWSC
ncbi:hypothetical protein ASF93_13760 [Microbacterium sp. Leaf347]|nr:hypothetical protein ASF93_13760 [Microbacterium sp. Leaf347]KQS05378.1 hypothetical protein ASG00_08700 [Microbacterium sp. Leaf351]ODU51644.1 MAG: hypothetical protein ABT07_02195 [Microbacterium sp. SCN 70-10]OJU74440.1 MAG: hypothetical protein BGO15_00395 [Microbacterium sp. 71-23]